MKVLSFLLILFVLLCINPAAATAAEPAVVVDGEKVEFNNPLLMEEGRIYTPLREIYTALDAVVSWDEETMTAVAVTDEIEIGFPIGGDLLIIDNNPIFLNVPVHFMYSYRSYIPLRFATESLGANVSWESAGEAAVITTTEDGVDEWMDKIHNGGFKTNVNEVDLEELVEIEGIDENMAQGIITHRESIGGVYRSFAELSRVPSLNDDLYNILTENVRIVYTDRGIGSSYGGRFHGNMTYFGEIYDMYQHTTAHPSLPHNTIIKVTYPQTGRSVWVRVNDRGPCQRRHPDRIIDLSRSAANAIGLTTSIGIDYLELEIYKEK